MQSRGDLEWSSRFMKANLTLNIVIVSVALRLLQSHLAMVFLMPKQVFCPSPGKSSPVQQTNLTVISVTCCSLLLAPTELYT